MTSKMLPRRRRILFVAQQACGNPALCAEVRAHAEGAADVLVVAPVSSSPVHRWTSDDAEDRAFAEARLDESVSCLREHGLHAHGTVGDADPVQAVEDALHGFPAEEVVICLEEPEQAHWLRKGVVERARQRFAVPVTEIALASRKPVVV
jgi:hypothetical protein